MNNLSSSYLKGIFIILSSFLILSCSTKKKVESSNIQTITFGSFGGFSGLKTAYSVNLLNKKISLNDKEYTNITNKDLVTILDLVQELDFEKLDINHPHNKSQFIEILYTNTKKKVTWGDPSYAPPEQLKVLYAHLLELVKK